jgi:ABC-type lipoprotein export system ATPase subunit
VPLLDVLQRFRQRGDRRDVVTLQLEQQTCRTSHGLIVFHHQNARLPDLLGDQRRAIDNWAIAVTSWPAARRQDERERRALAHLGAHIELEREQLHQALHDGEAQTIAIARDVGRNAHLIELIVDVRQLIRRNADARIEHLDTN